jgi:hypothetical protein
VLLLPLAGTLTADAKKAGTVVGVVPVVTFPRSIMVDVSPFLKPAVTCCCGEGGGFLSHAGKPSKLNLKINASQ